MPFPASLTETERRNYFTIVNQGKAGGPDGCAPEVREAIEDLQWSNALVLVYPTWWFNVPGTLKGFIDRTFLPDVAFRLPKENSSNGTTETGLQPCLTNIEKLGVVSTFGAPSHIVMAAGDNGRRMLSHGLRPLFHPQCMMLHSTNCFYVTLFLNYIIFT